MGEKTQMGLLLFADISSFTFYLAKVELEHAHEILTDILKMIVKEFKTLLTISKLEVFAPIFIRKREWKEPVADAACRSGYALFTEDSLSKLDLKPEGLEAVELLRIPFV